MRISFYVTTHWTAGKDSVSSSKGETETKMPKGEKQTDYLTDKVKGMFSSLWNFQSISDATLDGDHNYKIEIMLIFLKWYEIARRVPTDAEL